jgi:hypothetical protein
MTDDILEDLNVDPSVSIISMNRNTDGFSVYGSPSVLDSLEMLYNH